ncbi:MAG: N-formylglutamate amidohydrolase [Rhodobacteraceae bacterium]|nr:N-formylglutamate amidohydrolase [Paracoccaceae bacterium]
MSECHQEGGVNLLAEGDPEPVTIVNAASASNVVLICEHAGNMLPKSVDGLGLAAEVMSSHIALDIGVAPIARRLADLLDAPLVLQNYSRLVYDCNRDHTSPDAIPTESDGVPVPGNTNLTDIEKAMRHRAVFKPYAEAIEAVFKACPRRISFSIHSFTRTYQDTVRPWHAGILYRQDFLTARILLETLRQRLPEAEIAYNRPYHVTRKHDWFVTRFAEPRRLRHGIFEICNAMIREQPDQDRWSNHLLAAIRNVLQTLD